MRLADYLCPEHGLFETLEQSHLDYTRCTFRDENGNECGLWSAWSPSPVHGRVSLASVSTGRYEPPPTKQYLDTRKLGEGQTMQEFRAERAKVHEERRHKSNKELS